ncbi:hypothetical protein MJD09_09040, partial [bacterium]|nr:hypothetical protein [bacterium]
MDEPKYNMALMLNAQAYGDFVPLPTENNYLGRYRKEHQELEESPPLPKLPFGPVASLSSEAGTTLDASIVNVFVFRRNEEINEIMTVGRGVPELRQEIFEAAFSCALQTQAGDLDMINGDIFRIFTTQDDQPIFDLPGITTLGESSVFSSSNSPMAFNEFLKKMRRLQKRTGLVAVHECKSNAKESFDRELRSFAKRAGAKDVAIIVAKNAEKWPDMINCATLVPYYRIARRPMPMRVVFDPAILELPSFIDLLEAFTLETVERIQSDSNARKETYEKYADDLRKENERWRKADANARQLEWDEFVLLTERFDVETGRSIRLANPERRTTEEWMKNTVPNLIKQYEMWAERMKQIIQDIKYVKKRPDTPIRRLAASRFLDIALRGADELIHGENVRIYFGKWSRQVAPFLRLRWRMICDSLKVDPKTVLRHNTVFHTRFQVDESNKVIGLIMQ